MPGPDTDVTALIARGHALEDAGDPQAALAVYRQALALAPGDARVHLNIGNAAGALGQTTAAIAAYRSALGLDRNHAGAHFNLGNALLASGDAGGAASAFGEAVRIREDWAEGWVGLACALEEGGAGDGAVAAYRRALALEPGHAGAVANLSALLDQAGRSAEAAALLDRALHEAPDALALLRRKAAREMALADMAGAAAMLERVVAQAPDDDRARSDLLFCRTALPDADPARLLAEHRRFGEGLAARVGPRPALRVSAEPDRRLRIGYVSPDLRRHPIACFVAPVLRHHDRAAVEVHCYYAHAEADDVTALLRQRADHWHDIAGEDDADTAARIAADGIDILVDLSGHTAGNRLATFARQPAPVQMTWLGYLGTTGLRAMDYRLCDARTDPPGTAEAQQVEAPLRLPDSQWCYEALNAVPAPGPLPFLANGHWTFGSFNQPLKLNPRVLETWARLLQAVPGSRLRVLGLGDPAIVERVRAQLVGAGVEAARLDLRGRLPVAEYYAALASVDVALDTFPYNGGTTTCDTLLAGVPVLAIAGTRAVARGGVSLLSAVGLEDWIAASAADFTACAQRQLAEPVRLAALRAALPGRMRASPLMDAPRFVRHLEALYRQAWRSWCARAVSAPPARTSPGLR